MPNVNLTDSRSRDAVVKAETTGVDEEIRYVDTNGQSAYTRRFLKATVTQDYDTLVQQYGDAESLGKALVENDPEVDMEVCGLHLWGVSKVYVNSSDGIVYRIEQSEIVRGPGGRVKEKRPRKKAEANVDIEIPLTWTGRNIDKSEAVRRFVFSSKLQIVHVNGLTYDFLYGMAKELAKADSLMMIGGGSKGRDPLVFRSGSVPYRGFLEGRIDGDKYILLLHLSNLELKVPAAKKRNAKSSADESTKPEAPSDKVASVSRTPKKTTKKAKTKSKSPVPEKAEADTGKKETAKTSSKKSVPKSGAKSKKKKSTTENAESGKSKSPGQATQGQAGVSSDDLGAWLKSVRMGKYLQLFLDNEIDVDVLPELSDADLKELDIPLGSRRRLLKAVAEADNLRAEVAMAVSAMSSSKSKKKSSAAKIEKQKK